MRTVTLGPGARAAALTLLVAALRLAQRQAVRGAPGSAHPAGPTPDLSIIKLELRLGASCAGPPSAPSEITP